MIGLKYIILAFFVIFYDVSKAFDTVWTNGLFYKMYNAGITSRIWRLLYRAYEDVKCRVRIENRFFLSLMKYSVFINGHLDQLENSKLCCTIFEIPSCLAGYADDLATASLSKLKTDSSRYY